LSVDFNRHIVNPVLNRYMVDQDKVRILSEVKKLFQQGEDVYRFSIYNGDPRNLSLFLRSDIFTKINEILEASNMAGILVEILREARAAYSGVREVVETIDELLQQLGARDGETGGEVVLEKLKRVFENSSVFKRVELKGNRLLLEASTGWLIEVAYSKKGYRLKTVLSRNYSRRNSDALLREVLKLAEWISGLRL